MSDFLNEHPCILGDGAAAREPTLGAHVEQQPDAAGVGRAQRSEPERSDGERSGARPTPAPSPYSAPGVPMSGQDETNVPYDSAGVDRDEQMHRQPKLVGRAKGRRL